MLRHVAFPSAPCAAIVPASAPVVIAVWSWYNVTMLRSTLITSFAGLVAGAVCLLAPVRAVCNTSPNTPVFNEPSTPGQIVNPSDLHMETLPFSDPDIGDTHVCSDWQIQTAFPVETIWVSSCVGGLLAVHNHLGDGTFVSSHLGRTELFSDTDYLVRVRHRDNSGDPGTEWSAWAEQPVTTGPPTQIFAMELDDILSAPAPTLKDQQGIEVVLSAAPGPPAVIVSSAPLDELLLYVGGDNGITNLIINPPPLAGHVDVRVIIDAGTSGNSLTLPETDLKFVDDEGKTRTIFLPDVVVPPLQQAHYWVAADGSTFFGSELQTVPDFSQLARGGTVPWTTTELGYSVEIVATGFQLPVNIAFIPNAGPNPSDPFFYVTELYGNIKVVKRDGTISDYATGLLNFNPTGNFPGSGELGLAGIVVEPQTGDVFASMVYSEDPGNEQGPHHPKIDRFTSVDGGLTATTQTTVLDMASAIQGPSHQVSNLTIGPDDKLYIHMGDGFNTAAAQDTTSFLGKILRVNLDGSPVFDNPFYSVANGITETDYIHAYGLRNPFAGAWRASDGRHFIAENGPFVDRLTDLVAGRNYLHDGTDTSMFNFAIYNWQPSAAPVACAVIETATFGGSGFPAEKMDRLFVSESGPTWATGVPSHGKKIVEFEIDASGTLVGGRDFFLQYQGVGKATVAGVAAGPDGLYFTDLYKDVNFTSPIDPGANVLRVRFVGVADFVADVTTGTAPLTVNFTDLSTAPSPTEWLWDFGDGATSTLQNPSHEYQDCGSYTVRLQTTGATGILLATKPDYVVIFTPVSVGSEQPPRFELHANYPNPFRAKTEIAYQLPSAGHVELVIYDVLGRRVRKLVSGTRQADLHVAIWDGRNDRGERVASGVYLYRLQLRGGGGSLLQTKKMLFVK